MKASRPIAKVMDFLKTRTGAHATLPRHILSAGTMAVNENETETPEGIVVAEADALNEDGAGSGEQLTGFEPRDKHAPAPDRVPSALETFKPPPASEPVVEVDPIGAVSDKERKEHRQAVDGIVKAQRDAETLVGVSLRR
jgi:hypothetical protein